MKKQSDFFQDSLTHQDELGIKKGQINFYLP